MNGAPTLDDYEVFRIPKRTKPGQPPRYRVLHAPKPELKAKQGEILAELMVSGLAASPFAYAYVKGRSLRDMGEQHLGAHYALKMDLKDFFPSIRAGSSVRGLLRHLPSFSRDDVVRTCFLPGARSGSTGGLPQGAPTSPFLSNLAARSLDYQLRAFLSRAIGRPMRTRRVVTGRPTIFGALRTRNVRMVNHQFLSAPIAYTRYADDLTFSSRDPHVLGMVFPIQRIIQHNAFEVNRKKTRRIKKGGRIEVCGVVVNDVLNARRSYRRDVRSAVHRAVRDVISGRCEPGFQLVDGVITPVDVEALLGKLSFISQLNPELAMNSLFQILMEVHGKPRAEWSYNTNSYLQPNNQPNEQLTTAGA